MNRILGVIVHYSESRGYGFIRAGKNDYFFHLSSVHDVRPGSLEVGNKAEFTTRSAKKGLQAVDIRIVEIPVDDSKGANPWVFMKKNPFTPQEPITDAHKFAGRKTLFHNAVDAIYNNKSILISGPRGIGKSSLSYQLLFFSAGDNSICERVGIDMGGESLDRLVADHRCVPGNSLETICSALISTLLANVGRHERLKGRVEKAELGLKFFKVGEERKFEQISSEDLANRLAIDLASIFRSLDNKARGLTLLIDEIDVLLDEVDIAPFLKAVLERLRISHHLDASFIISGVTGTTTKLLQQHPSSGRLFENFVVDPMRPDELSEILDLCLKDTGVEITEHARNRIIRLSNSFPHPVHLLGYHAYRLDGDALIDVEDISKAKEFIVQHIKNQEFQERYERLIKGGMREVIKAMAMSKHDTVNIAYLRRMIRDMNDRTIFGTIGELENSAIIDKQTGGTYRFRDPLFKIYLRWILGLEELSDDRNRRSGRK